MRIIKQIIEFFKKLFGLYKKKPLEPPTNNLIDTSPRGIAMLHAMVPQAWDANVAQIVDILIASRLRNIAINVLIGGGFGLDEPRINHIVHKLSEGGRKVHLLLYVTNGASQRAWNTTLVDGLGAKTKPEIWREQIKNHAVIQGAYENRLNMFRRTIESVLSLGGEVRICPALEDNLDDVSFATLANLTKNNYPTIPIIRNPCSGCYPGNTDTIPPGILHEAHLHDNFANPPKAHVLTNDGKDWTLTGRVSQYKHGYVNLQKLSTLRDAASAQGAWYIAWNARAQGLETGTPNPYKRTYAPYDNQEMDALIEHLKGE